jgi:GTPase SAR1 family protein
MPANKKKKTSTKKVTAKRSSAKTRQTRIKLVTDKKETVKKVQQKSSTFGKSISFNNLEDGITSLINDIAFFRDISNDFSDDSFKHDCNELTMLDKYATSILKDSIRIQSNSEPFCLAIVGNFSSGKSTFINSLLGKDICPEDIDRTTSSVTRFVYSPSISVWQIIEKSGQLTKKEITNQKYQQLVAKGSNKKNEKLSFEYRYPWEDLRDITIIDTPGFSSSDDIRSESSGDSETTEEIIASDADVLFWVIDIQNGEIKRDELERLDRLVNNSAEHLKIYIILNKADLKPHVSQRTEIRKKVMHATDRYAQDIYLYSARSEKKDNKSDLEKLINELKKQLNEQAKSPKGNWELKVNVQTDPCDDSQTFSINNSNNNYDLSTDKSIGLSRGEILKKLNELKAIKPELLSIKLKREQRKYLSSKKTVIKELSSKIKILIKTTKKSKECENSLTTKIDIEKKLDKWRKDICHNFESQFQANVHEQSCRIISNCVKLEDGLWSCFATIEPGTLLREINTMLKAQSPKIFTSSKLMMVDEILNKNDIITNYEAYCYDISTSMIEVIKKDFESKSKSTKILPNKIQYAGDSTFEYNRVLVIKCLNVKFEEFLNSFLTTTIIEARTINDTTIKLKTESLKTIDLKLDEYIKRNKLC